MKVVPQVLLVQAYQRILEDPRDGKNELKTILSVSMCLSIYIVQFYLCHLPELQENQLFLVLLWFPECCSLHYHPGKEKKS